MADIDPILSNPIWHALTNEQATIARGDHLARRYPTDIAPFGAVATNSDEAFDHLAALMSSGESVALVGGHPKVGDMWALLGHISLVQMVYDGPALGTAATMQTITSLSAADVPAMRQLVEMTHPGPFMPRTIELGRYLAIWQEGQLAAMAGERMHVPGYREISAVCTHPAFQRRGYAQALVLRLIHEIQNDGEVPFLHVFRENKKAIALYEVLGFKKRGELSLFTLQRQ